jgi:hypothetical protein
MFGSILMSVVVWFGVKLQGSFVVFWLVYFATICVGIGAGPAHLGAAAWGAGH